MEGDFKIGEWLVSPALNQISNDGKSARVEPKAMQVLVQLAGAEGVVNKDRLISTVWPDVFVTDDVLPGCIASLRRAFDDNARKPKIIETIPKSGYRLLLPVEPCNGNGQRGEATKQPAAGVRASDQAGRRWWLAGAVAGGLLILVLAGWRFAFPAGYDSVAILPALVALWVWEQPRVNRRAVVAGLLIGAGATIETVPIVMLLALIPWAGCVWALPFLSVLAPSERAAQSQVSLSRLGICWRF